MNFSSIKWVGLVLLIVVLGGLLGCSAEKVKTDDWKVSVAQAQELWEKQKAIIIDVRTEEEYAQGHIPGVALIPLNQLESRIKEVPTDKQVLVICRSGSRSLQATQILRGKGYTNVYNITEGMNNWKGPVVKTE